MSENQSDIFKYNFMSWKVFGIWPGKVPNKRYRYYSFMYLLITLVVYNILLTLNLIYTPAKIELLIREVIFYFTEIVVTAKVLMILLMRDQILMAFKLLDSDEFKGDDEITKCILNKSNTHYKTFHKLYSIFSNIAYSSQVFVPVLLTWIQRTGSEQELPICRYYFLSEEIRQSYFVYWFIYQAFGMYGHMMYNVNIDSFIAGLLLMAITQVRMLKAKLFYFKLSPEERRLTIRTQEAIQMARLNRILRHYERILDYTATIQKILSATVFVQFGVASTIICVVMCGLLLPSSTETLVFLVMYLFLMTMQIFLPGYLGTLLTFESQNLGLAAYSSEWIPRSESFKRSLKLFVERAKTPIVITGLEIFPLSLITFISIMKTAYSFFTLIRNFQNKQD